MFAIRALVSVMTVMKSIRRLITFPKPPPKLELRSGTDWKATYNLPHSIKAESTFEPVIRQNEIFLLAQWKRSFGRGKGEFYFYF